VLIPANEHLEHLAKPAEPCHSLQHIGSTGKGAQDAHSKTIEHLEGESMIDLGSTLQRMAAAGLSFRRKGEQLEIMGDQRKLTEELREAIARHADGILALTGAAVQKRAGAPGRGSERVAVCNEIHRQLCEIAAWLQRFAVWARPEYLEQIDRRLAAAADSRQVQRVAAEIASIQAEVQAVQWAAEVLPLAFEAEARHAAEAGAGPAPGCPDPGGVPF